MFRLPGATAADRAGENSSATGVDTNLRIRQVQGGRSVRGAQAVAGRAIRFAQPSAIVRPALVNGAAGVVVIAAGRPVSVMAFTVRNGKIVEIDTLADPDRLGELDLAVLDD